MNKQNDASKRNDFAMFSAGFVFVLLAIMAPNMYHLYKDASEMDFGAMAESTTTVLERTTFATPQDRNVTKAAFAVWAMFFALMPALCLAFATLLVATGWIAFREYTLPSSLQDESPP